MFDGLIRWSLNNRAAVIAMALLLTATGLYTVRHMPVDVFPDLTAPTVTIITEAHGMAPTEVESQVTFPIEAAVNGASGVRRVRSSTAVGISVVWVEFDWNMDIYAARQIVSEKVALVAGTLPPEAARPILAPISSVMGEILFLALTSERHSPIELRTVADTTIPPSSSGRTRSGTGHPDWGGYQTVSGRAFSRTASHLWRQSHSGERCARRLQ
jgi:Cu/Ag efflux pump CusA